LPTAAGFGKPDVTSSGALIFRAVSFWLLLCSAREASSLPDSLLLGCWYKGDVNRTIEPVHPGTCRRCGCRLQLCQPVVSTFWDLRPDITVGM
jgi:hypothetical protein